MSAPSHTLLGGFSRMIFRADLISGEWRVQSAARATGSSTTEAFASALALAPVSGRDIWLLSDEWFHQTIVLPPAQVAGLNSAQLGRALAFEAEPYSGIPMSAAALGFHRSAEGSYDVVALPAESRTRLALLGGAGFRGIAFADPPPEDEVGMHAWLRRILGDLESGVLPVVGAPVAPPSRARFRTAALVMQAAALLLLVGGWMWIKSRTTALEHAHARHARVTNELQALQRQSQASAAEIDKLRADLDASHAVSARRLALASLLQGLALHKPDGMVLRQLRDEGPSSSRVSGVALAPDAIDELAIVLKETLGNRGWSVFPGSKKALNKLPNGGPWEFTMTMVHEEAAHEGVHLQSEEDNR